MNALLSATTCSPGQTQAVGRALGEILQAGGLIMLCGSPEAGETTFTQDIGEGMGVRGRVTFPTLTVARVHHSLSGGPDFIHADAYRIHDPEDLETLNLDSNFADSAIVVEWDKGKTEAMSEECLEIDAKHATGGEAAHDSDTINLGTMDDGERRVELCSHGTRWDGMLDRILVRAREIIAEGEAQAFDEGEKTDGAGAESVAPASDEQN